MGSYIYPQHISFQDNLNRVKACGLRALVYKIVTDYGLRLTYKTLCRLSPYKSKTFILNNQSFTYNTTTYNDTFANERTVEIPIAQEFIQSVAVDSILEVGCVLPHYQTADWTVVDKFEPGKDIIHEDILTYQPHRSFRRIICLSTLEHIGQDDSTYQPGLGITALERMKRWLLPHGLLMTTVPIGYNPILDQAIFNKSIFTQTFYLKRTSVLNTWTQATLSEVFHCRYGWPFNNANGLCIGIYQHSSAKF